MGAAQFESHGNGKSVHEAFNECVRRSEYDYGHAGYTGTIAEKEGYVLIDVPNGYTCDQVVEGLEDTMWETKPAAAWQAFIDRHGEGEAARIASIYHDKWGPAVAMALEGHDNCWLFTGYASS